MFEPSSRQLRVTGADRDHLRAVGTVWSTNFGLEFTLTEMPSASEVDAALAQACDRSPRMRSRVRGDRWVPGPAPRSTYMDDPERLRTSAVDDPFEPSIEAPLRIVISGNRLLLACMHGACDTPGLVGFASDVFLGLSGSATPAVAAPAVRPLLERDAWRPGVVRSLRALRRRPQHHVTPFPSTGPAVADNGAAVWSASPEETRAALASVGDAGPAAVAAQVLLERCLRDAQPGRWATLFVPVNLRPDHQRWRPVGNHIGHLLLHHDRPEPAEVLAAETRAARGPARYAAPWQRLIGDVRRAVKGSARTLPDTVALEEPEISVNVNNLGRLEPALLPGVEEMVFVGSNSPLYPVLTIQTVGQRMTVCARVRLHQGGQEVAGELVALVRDRLTPQNATP